VWQSFFQLILKGNSFLERTPPQFVPKVFVSYSYLSEEKIKKALQIGLSVRLKLDKSSYRRR